MYLSLHARLVSLSYVPKNIIFIVPSLAHTWITITSNFCTLVNCLYLIPSLINIAHPPPFPYALSLHMQEYPLLTKSKTGLRCVRYGNNCSLKPLKKVHYQQNVNSCVDTVKDVYVLCSRDQQNVLLVALPVVTTTVALYVLQFNVFIIYCIYLFH